MFHTLYSIHASSWVILLIAFFLTYILESKKVMGIILRIFYIVMLGTGIGMIAKMGFPANFVVKGILAIILIGLMEMLLARQKRNKKAMPLWILFIIVVVIVILMGYQVISF
ncbi:YisL family protein [Bacillus sp. 1P06AnD]|uniref:YisL family protein n=1 Tax=Bacillus sp. 1P06AnD TaxID=3132208 RepID=UPI0039A2A1F9